MTPVTDYSTFWVADHRFAVEAASVQEVIPLVPCTPIPQTTPEVDGLINLRGQIVLAMNLRRRFQLEAQPTRSPRANLIVHTGDGLVSLRVDQLGDVISLDHDQLEPLPPSVPRQMRELARGVFQLDDSLLILLDVSRLATQEACVEAD